MANIPTESRIFADRYFREARQLEALHAAMVSPGTKTWDAALAALFDRMEAAAGPIKRAAVLKAAIAAIKQIDPGQAMHVNFFSYAGKRAAALAFATFRAGGHPFDGLDEDGLSIMKHLVHCHRGGRAELLADVCLAYVSWHAVARLHERDYQLTPGSAFGVFAHIGILGHLTRHSERHIRGGLHLRFHDVLVAGSLKHAAARNDVDGTVVDGTFYDVRTVLPADEVTDQAKLEQGRIAFDVIQQWFKAGRVDKDALAEQIPFLPRREDDHTLRALAGAAGEV